jgi:hypothetical protein
LNREITGNLPFPTKIIRKIVCRSISYMQIPVVALIGNLFR